MSHARVQSQGPLLCAPITLELFTSLARVRETIMMAYVPERCRPTRVQIIFQQ